MMTKAGSNWTFTRGTLAAVVTRAVANGRTIYEVQIREKVFLEIVAEFHHRPT